MENCTNTGAKAFVLLRANCCTNCHYNFNPCSIFEKMTSFTPILNQEFQPRKVAKRTKSKNRMQITKFLARLSQQKRVLREIQGIWAKFSFHKCFKNNASCPLRNLQTESSTIPVCLSESCLSHDVTRALRY